MWLQRYFVQTLVLQTPNRCCDLPPSRWLGFPQAVSGSSTTASVKQLLKPLPLEGIKIAKFATVSGHQPNYSCLSAEIIGDRLLYLSHFVTKYEELLSTRNNMFGGLTGLTNPPGTDWGERMLNSVASKTIRHLFTQSESVEVFVRCYPSSKLLQGSIDSFKMSGRGLVIRKDFGVEEMSFETDAVAIDFSSVLSGKLSLKQPTQAVAQVTLSEAGLNHSFKAELVKKRLQNLSLPALTELSGGEPVSFTEVQLELLPNNQVRILAKADLSTGDLVPISLTATLAVERRRRIASTLR